MAAALVPLAHAGHWMWVLYLPPVLIVIGSLLRTALLERRKKRDGGTGSGPEVAAED